MSAVPDRYRGLWTRTRYVEPAAGEPIVADTSTWVFWLQTALWHVDLRIPAAAPDFGGIKGLADCDRERLVWIAGLTAFAGRTIVAGCFCTWHRLVDMAPELEKDIGKMCFGSDGTLEEHHPEGRYRERWAKLPDDGQTREVVKLDAGGLPVWLQHGSHAFIVRARPQMADDHDLLAPPAALATDALRVRAALEISYAHRGRQGWRVERSTHPWRVGDICVAPP